MKYGKMLKYVLWRTFMGPAVTCLQLLHRNQPNWLIDWLINYDGARLCLRTAAINGPIVHPSGDMWAWSAMWWWFRLGITPDSSTRALWQSYQQRHLGQVGGMDEGVRILPIQYLKYLKGSLTFRKILRHGTSGFTSHPKEGVLRICIALKSPSPRPGLTPRPWGPVTSTPTTTPPRRPTNRNLWQDNQSCPVFESAPPSCRLHAVQLCHPIQLCVLTSLSFCYSRHDAMCRRWREEAADRPTTEFGHSRSAVPHGYQLPYKEAVRHDSCPHPTKKSVCGSGPRGPFLVTDERQVQTTASAREADLRF
jgi:hypothetical protein